MTSKRDVPPNFITFHPEAYGIPADHSTPIRLTKSDLIANLALRVNRLEKSKGSGNMTQYVSEKRVAKTGERIVVVAPYGDREPYEQGDIFNVEEVDSSSVTTTSGNILYHDEYEVLPEAMPTLPTIAELGLSADEAAHIAANCTRALGYSQDDDSDNVNNPAHYTQGKFETIDIIAHIVSGYDDPFVGHCVGTAVKYVSRAPYKHDTPLEDMRKAKRYIEFAIERLEGER